MSKVNTSELKKIFIQIQKETKKETDNFRKKVYFQFIYIRIDEKLKSYFDYD